jgi:membrane associated rhomboid family serine protease
MREEMAMMGLPRPGKALLWVMGVLLSIWIFFAIGINWLHFGGSAFSLLVGNTDAILQGEVWRFFTAGLVHLPAGERAVSHILYSLLGLYFLGPSLEARWGSKRMLLFLIGSTVFGFTLQFLFQVIVPGPIGIFGQAGALMERSWFGSMGAVEAVAVAWALSHRNETVRFMFLLPMTGTGLLFAVIGISLLYLFAGHVPSEGLITPFAGMLAGYLFGAGNPTPARRLVLKIRYFWIARRAAKYRGSQPRLRVIEGGDAPRSRRKPPSDKRFLN